MRLHIGQRLAGTGPALQPGGYVVTGVVAETPWYGLYAGKRIFYNFDFTNKRLRETDEAEWLDVYLRTVRYQPGEGAEHGRLRRELARAEVRRVLSNRFSNLWPEPIDLLEIADGRVAASSAADTEHGAPADDREPIVIFARPNGESLGAWQRKVVPLASVLTVLAELLEFLRQAHAEGLLLQGLGPGAILVDPSDRIHYLGADMVLDQRADAARQWHEVFAPERLPRGFAAPELLESAGVPDARSDLYSWGALAYFLFTGHSPEQIAIEQGKDWANFQRQHFERLSKSLEGIPVTHCRNWAEQLGIGDQALLGRWPANVIEVFRYLLHHDRQRRPKSVEELLGWIEAPPPPPVNALVAVMVGPGEARVCVDLEGLGDNLDLVIRRGVDRPPRTPQDGTLLEQGPAAAMIADPAVPLTPAPVYYTAFLRRATSNGPIFSTGITGELLTATPAALRQFAEAEARLSRAEPGKAEHTVPPRLALCFRALESVQLADVLLVSAEPQVRSWAIEQLRATLSAKEPQPASAEALDPAERVLWHALPDPIPALKVQTVRALLARQHSPTDDLALSLARAIVKGDLDQAEHAVQVLREAGVKAEQAKWVLDFLEGERPLTCPECQAQLQRRERLSHLHNVHGYVEVGGSWLPRPTALERLWGRVLEHGDVPAHDRLLEVLAGFEDTYAALLEQELARRETAVSANGNNVPARLKKLEAYEKCLLAPRMHDRLPDLLRSRNPLVRALGQNASLAALSGKLRGLRMQPRELRAELSRLLPNLLEECIVLCRQLPGAGVDAEATAGCLRILEGERLTVCSECAAPVRIADLETHLRRAHGIFQFRGRRGNFRHTRSRVLDAALGPPADASAWQVLEELALDRHGRDADKCLAIWICHRFLQYRRKRQVAATAAAAGFLASGSLGFRLVPWLARRWKQPTLQILARALALNMVCRMKTTVAPEVIARVRPLLGARELPRLLRSRAVEAILKTTGPSGEQALDVLSAYVSQSGKLRAIDKLRRLEKR
ncbi:MAG: hypothetical protein HY040_15450, partial [Planctomycetes bacterium]|nr:hypothetical protein [Planctomycetota bacterium]